MRKRQNRNRTAAGLPRVPLPRQTGGAHEDKIRRPWRRRKHKRRPDADDAAT